MVTPGRLPLAVEARVLPARSDTWIFVRSVFAATGSERTRIGRGTRLLRACRQPPPAGYTDTRDEALIDRRHPFLTPRPTTLRSRN